MREKEPRGLRVSGSQMLRLALEAMGYGSFRDKRGFLLGKVGETDDIHEEQTPRKRRKSMLVSRRPAIFASRSFGRWDHCPASLSIFCLALQTLERRGDRQSEEKGRLHGGVGWMDTFGQI